MLKRNLEENTAAAINLLIQNSVSEQRTLDYKRDLPNYSDKSKAEFCKDISSFANTIGGWIIYGIDEAKDQNGHGLGYPDESGLVGVDSTNLHKRIEDLEQVLLTGLDPRISSGLIQMQPVEGCGPQQDKTVLIIRIGQSPLRLHRVKSDLKSPFYMRHSKGAFALDTREIRNAFVAMDSLAEVVREYPYKRLTSTILSGAAPRDYGEIALLIAHVIPEQSLATDFEIDTSNLGNNRQWLHPLNSGVSSHFYNVDGMVHVGSSAYLQLFRNAIVESVDSDRIHPWNGGRKNIPTQLVENDYISFVEKILSFYQHVGDIEPPIHLSLMLANVEGYGLHSQRLNSGVEPIRQAIVRLPQITLMDFPATAQEIGTRLKPMFDALAQAVNMPRSDSYRENGEFKRI